MSYKNEGDEATKWFLHHHFRRFYGDASKGLQYMRHHGGAGTSSPVIYGRGFEERISLSILETILKSSSFWS